MKAIADKLILAGLILATSLLPGFANAAINPAEVQAEFKRWTLEADAILQAQPKSSELRKNLNIWFTDQGRSLSKVKEPILSASLPSKMWGSAAYLLDSANQHASELNNSEYRSLLALSASVMEYCHQAYASQQTVCTDNHYWQLKASTAIYLAKLNEADASQQLASIPAIVNGSFVPFQGFYAKSTEEMATDECSSWTRLLARHLTDDYFLHAKQDVPESFVKAYFETTQKVLDLCESNHAEMAESKRYLIELAANVVSFASQYGQDAQSRAKAIAERANNAAVSNVP